jgi:hypothetical protein
MEDSRGTYIGVTVQGGVVLHGHAHFHHVDTPTIVTCQQVGFVRIDRNGVDFFSTV